MLAKVYSYGIAGLEVYPLTIEVDVMKSLPSTVIVGLPDNAVKESKERVRSAIKNSGFQYKPQRIIINLSPADIKKEGPSFDLPVALGLLAATEQIDPQILKDYIFLGELSLNGDIRGVSGVLPIAMTLTQSSFKGLICPMANALEACVAGNVKVYPANNLAQVVRWLNQPEDMIPFHLDEAILMKRTSRYNLDFSEVKGQSYVKRGLEIAAAGSHNVLLIGPPGSGKTMLAKRIPTILPDMTHEESLEVTKVHSIAGILPAHTSLLRTRPYRSPHHTASEAALIGGGSLPKPGEVSLSHHGVLFLDELPEFNRRSIEALRQPLEDHCVTVSRAARSSRFPAKFMLIASMNPCPCGWYMDPKKECHCTPKQIQSYISKISGPILDRIDIHLEVASLKSIELIETKPSEPSSAIKERTSQARLIQQERFSAPPRIMADGGKEDGIYANAHMTERNLKNFCQLDDEGKNLIKLAVEELGLSARAHDKILKIARTIADLEGKETIQPHHIAEAIQYRSLDRNWWG